MNKRQITDIIIHILIPNKETMIQRSYTRPPYLFLWEFESYKIQFISLINHHNMYQIFFPPAIVDQTNCLSQYVK